MVVIVLGQQLSQNDIHPELRARVETGCRALRETNARYLICSGGSTNEAVPRTEAAVMRDYANEWGVDRTRILTEDRSLDTIGNAYFTRLLVEDLEQHIETITLVTSAYHIDRAAYIFEQCFGDGYRIDTSFTAEVPTTDEQYHEERSLELANEFFDPVIPGDIDAVRQRLLEVHDYYGTQATVPSA